MPECLTTFERASCCNVADGPSVQLDGSSVRDPLFIRFLLRILRLKVCSRMYGAGIEGDRPSQFFIRQSPLIADTIDNFGEAHPVMHIEFDLSGRVVAINIAGELDRVLAETVKATIDGLGTGRVPAVTLDLTDVTFIDAAGIGVLIYARRSFSSEHFRLVTNHRVRKLLFICDLTASFAAYDQRVPDPRHSADS